MSIPEEQQPTGNPEAVDSPSEESQNDSQTAEQPSPEQRIEQLEAELAAAEKRRLQAQAELENARNRMRRDYEDQLKYASLPLIQDMLTVLDNLYRGLQACEGNAAATDLVTGISMVAKQFEESLAKFGCKPIPAEGEVFDPNYHEAISQMPSADVPAGSVVQVAVRGYQLHDRVVRPSQVVVSTGPVDG
jgi:molecular chaperone GrpE